MRKKIIAVFLALTLPVPAAFAQQHNSVPLGHEAYTLIELGVIRGAIEPPASVKPWSESIIRQKLSHMADNPQEKFSERELAIINNALKSFDRKKGFSLADGRYYSENDIAGHTFTFDSGLNWQSGFSVRLPEPAIATVNKGVFFFAGDMSSLLSWNFNVGGGFLVIDRKELGSRDNPPYLDPIITRPESEDWAAGVQAAGESKVYSIPAYFPYTFSKPYETAVFPPKNMGGYASWPDTFSFFYEMLGEINTSFFDNHLYLRFGKMRRDWGPEESGSSLFLNAAARPFMAVEGTAIPFKWLRFSFLTGSLEYLNKGNQWGDAEPYQNMLSMALLEIDTGRYFHLDFGSAAVYAKRPELGYFFPISSNFLYQNNIGDFDNLAMFADLEVRFSILKIWASFFVDEMRLDGDKFFNLNRNMYAYQAGVKSSVSWLPFGAFTLRYTKIEPYCYTHEYRQTPWNSVLIDTSYLNDGQSIGSYLPPNSDELLIKMEAMPFMGFRAHIQYQLVRHGADWGDGRVPGSSIWDKIIKNENTEKYFLRDGAYQWDHVIKLGASYSLKTFKIPVAFFAETGIVITRFTKSDAGHGKEGNYSPIDTDVYRAGNHFILSLGFRIYP